jgi:hypothetical protein
VDRVSGISDSLKNLKPLKKMQLAFLRPSNIFSLKVPERYVNCLWVSASMKGDSLSISPSREEWAMPYTANVGGGRMNPEIRILTVPNTNGLLVGRMSR